MKNLEGLVLPRCEILLNGQLRKLYGKKKNKVYLNNGDNFQLRFFNPLQERIGVQLKMNGQKVDDDLMVINPGQYVTIERFIGTNRKLTFNTYEIDASDKQAVKAIEKNGLLEVVFWNEKIKVEPIKPVIRADVNTISISGSSITVQSKDVVIDGNLIINGELKVTGRNMTSGTSGYNGMSGTSGAAGMAGSGGLPHFRNIDGYKTPGIFINDKDLSYSNSKSSIPYADYIAESKNNPIDYTLYLADQGLEQSRSFLGEEMVKKMKKETGRIEKGEISNQHFKPIQFEIGEAFYKIKFKLLPFSLKKVKKNSMIPQL